MRSPWSASRWSARRSLKTRYARWGLAVVDHGGEPGGDLSPIEADLMMGRLQPLCHELLVAPLVDVLIGEADREGVLAATPQPADDGRDQRGIEAAAQVEPEWDVGLQPAAGRALAQLGGARDVGPPGLGRAGGGGGRLVRGPILGDLHPPRPHLDAAAARPALDAR